MFENQSPTPLQRINSTLLEQKNITLYVKRDDLIHETISGNKWRKLKYNLLEAKAKGYKTLLTFGGAYSNHIAATAAAAKEYGFQSIGIIRGDELNENSNPTLRKAAQNGMQLHFVTRKAYRNKEQGDYILSLSERFGAFYLIPEGGSNTLAVKGCTEIIEEIDIDFDCMITAVGTGGTLSGIACGLASNQSALGISVLKGAKHLDKEVEKLISNYTNSTLDSWKINHEHHLGGYAKTTNKLFEFIQSFKKSHNIPLDQVYTGKMMMALFELIEKDYFLSGSVLVALHTGGLQGVSK